jgi:hypothetical protein
MEMEMRRWVHEDKDSVEQYGQMVSTTWDREWYLAIISMRHIGSSAWAFQRQGVDMDGSPSVCGTFMWYNLAAA